MAVRFEHLDDVERAEEVADLVVRMAKGNSSWDYRRIITTDKQRELTAKPAKLESAASNSFEAEHPSSNHRTKAN
jgi:hypothetical protein